MSCCPHLTPTLSPPMGAERELRAADLKTGLLLSALSGERTGVWVVPLKRSFLIPVAMKVRAPSAAKALAGPGHPPSSGLLLLATLSRKADEGLAAASVLTSTP